jgi:putative phosphotransacetylase
MSIPVEISARHVHLTEADFQTLFGEGVSLTFKKALSQPGEFLSNERVTIVGKKRNLENVAILGPFRKASQGEISMTDMRQLGMDVPVRESGDISGSAELRLIGPKGTLDLSEGLIVAKRHIHMTEADAQAYHVENKQIVRARIATDRSVIYEDVVVRVSERFVLAMHVDTDEGNAAGVRSADCFAEIV